MKILLFILTSLCFIGCEINDIIELSNFQKSFLIYSGGEKFTLVKNKEDTIQFRVVEYEIFDAELPYESVPRGYLEFERISLSKSKYEGKITVNGQNRYSFNFKEKNFAYRDTSGKQCIPMNMDSLIYLGTTTLNSVKYNDVYFIYDNSDSLYFSKDKGIIQIKFGKTKTIYDLLN